ncbi:hypothetical protein [Leeia aquatica]|uniref:Uncharacterized protein n=1 Tax=Leeia aquatica TaxID=2725557 RepID=A0A847SFC4_9NEIS|nr:hypothetical protein [Leeia aquatica]NLR75969.1 hypothetical protein [Leeia aquatica]
MKNTQLVCGLFASLLLHSAQAEVRDFSAEMPGQGVTPPRVVMLALWRGLATDDRQSVQHCLQDDRQPSRARMRYFRFFPVRLNADAVPDYIVLPATSPYCSGLYGAHIAGVWAVLGGKSPRLVYQDRVDSLRLLPAVGGWRVLQQENFSAAGAEVFRTEWRYRQSRYQPWRCLIIDHAQRRQQQVACSTP